MKYVLILVGLVFIAVLIRVVQGRREWDRIQAAETPEDPKELEALILDEFAQTLDPQTVPDNLRDLIPFAERWGIGDDPALGDLVRVSSETQRRLFVNALRDHTEKVHEWIDSFPDARSMPESAIAFMYMLDALELADSERWLD